MFRIEIHDFSAEHNHSDCFFNEADEKERDKMRDYINETLDNYLHKWGFTLIDFAVNVNNDGVPVLRFVFKRKSKFDMVVDDVTEIFIQRIVTGKEYCYEC